MNKIFTCFDYTVNADKEREIIELSQDGGEFEPSSVVLLSFDQFESFVEQMKLILDVMQNGE